MRISLCAQPDVPLHFFIIISANPLEGFSFAEVALDIVDESIRFTSLADILSQANLHRFNNLLEDCCLQI